MNVLIIGGSSDIGVSLAKYLVETGNKVVVSYFRHARKIDNVEYVECDIKSEDAIEKITKYVIDKYGMVDILINMAAISSDSYYLDKTKEEFMKVLEVNLVGTFLCNKIYSKYINDGVIVNVASTDGISTGSIYNLDYSASKAGIINMSKIINTNTSNNVICICPNWVDSETTRMMDKDYLVSELKRIGQSRLITIDELTQSIYLIMNKQKDKNNVYVIDIKDDNLWIGKI